MRDKKDILKQLKTISITEIKDIFKAKRFVISSSLESRITKLVNTIAGKDLYNLGEHGFSGSKQNNSITFYLGQYDIDVIFTTKGNVKDFSVNKTACDLGGLI
jgi:hypothetical protein